ncbi:MAG TPA: tRNA (adenosine(37)-N6)-threonylcarbamoyltransferase complex dimerization subunit type 1 TsaB [Stellaceae bacterium]|nr:tRNA (adenosine(37)-N6)-threonylcarbamoyltransferase complex dimerization subunit type 1 TsaB [Stellaceae bacterium]
MTILALDTSGAACSVALRDQAGRLLAHRFEALQRGHAERLMPMLREAMEEAAVDFAGLALIAVTTGPGSFTGIRVGLAAARGLALASGLPILGVTAFEALAAAVPPAERHGRALLVAIDSRRGDFFIQSFAGDGSPLSAPEAVPAEELAAAVPAGDVLLAGDGAVRAATVLAAAGHAALLTSAAGPPDAAAVAAVALARWHPGERPMPPLPLYLRAPDVTLPAPRPAPR